MLPLLFDDIRFRQLAQTPENIHVLRDTFNVFQWIFYHRFMEDELNASFHSPNIFGKVDPDTADDTMTAYRAANLKIVTLMIRKHKHLGEHFVMYNSYEKISWETFIFVVRELIPDFDALQFGILLEKFLQKDDCPLGARLIFDFQNSHEWFEYMAESMSQHRIRVGTKLKSTSLSLG